MRPAPTSPSGARVRARIRPVLLGTVLIVAVAFGLVTMHGLGLHLVGGGHAPEPPVTLGWHAPAHGVSTVASAVEDGAGHGVAPLGAVTGHSGHGTDEVSGTVMACLVLLLIVVVALRRPRLSSVVGWAPLPVPGATPSAVAALPAAPSLRTLCISRT